MHVYSDEGTIVDDGDHRNADDSDKPVSPKPSTLW